MAGTNEILTWAQGVGANVATQSAFNTATARTAGVGAGVADSSLYNKVTRQSAFVVAALSQWLVDQTGGSVLDNGDTANVKALLTTTVQTLAQALITGAGYATVGAMNAADNGLQAQITAEVNNRAGGDSNLFSDYIARIAAEATARSNGDVTEANARAAVDNNLWVNFNNYMARGSTWGGNILQNYFSVANQTVHNDFSITFPTNVMLFLIGTVNVSNAPQPGICTMQTWVDGAMQITQASNTSMTQVHAHYLTAGAHVFAQTYTTPNVGGTFSQVDLTSNYIYVEV